jgi:hypothetical protein
VVTHRLCPLRRSEALPEKHSLRRSISQYYKEGESSAGELQSMRLGRQAVKPAILLRLPLDGCDVMPLVQALADLTSRMLFKQLIS